MCFVDAVMAEYITIMVINDKTAGECCAQRGRLSADHYIPEQINAELVDRKRTQIWNINFDI